MADDQTMSLIWLWILQAAWWLAAMLPLAVAGILVVLGLKFLDRRARVIEEKPVEPGSSGFVQLLRDKFAHQALGQLMLFSIFGGLALGGLAGLFLQSLLQPGVQKAIEAGGIAEPEAVTPAASGPSLDLILLLALVTGAVMVVLTVYAYRVLCRQAAEQAGSLTAPGARRPLLVRLFYDSKKIGITVLVIGSWLCFGMIMQVVGLVVVVVPWPAGIAAVSAPWAFDAAAFVLVAVSGLLFLAPFALAVWMGVRHFKLEIRSYRGNPVFRQLVHVVSIAGIGAMGALLFMYLLDRTGIAPISGNWFDFVPALWAPAYVSAYAASLVVLAVVCRRRKRSFTLMHIGIAFLAAFPGSIPFYYVLFSLLARFFAGLFGKP